MPTTRVLIRNDGKVVIEGINYVGNQCLVDLQRLQDMLKSLGVEVNIEAQRKKPEAQLATSEEVIQHEG
ncbi:MAG: hypothetical protein DRJ18_01935 [Candidatus Methanomethylicota archaeon]|nr:MAG: hypothetical protein DRJ18_01935 [Candidatus Verstraetearchaeota archaeon]